MKKKHLDWKTAGQILLPLVMLVLLQIPAAADIANSTLGTGTKKLISDASTYLMVLCPIAGAMAGGYFFIRRSMADRQDGKEWNDRIKVAILCGVGGCLINGVIALLSSYF